MADILGFPHGPRPGDVYTPCDVEPPCEGSDLERLEKAHNPVTNPPHYNQGGVEAIEIIEHIVAGYKDPIIAGLVWQVLKYLIRAPHKNGSEDLLKARWYLNRVVNKLG